MPFKTAKVLAEATHVQRPPYESYVASRASLVAARLDAHSHPNPSPASSLKSPPAYTATRRSSTHAISRGADWHQFLVSSPFASPQATGSTGSPSSADTHRNMRPMNRFKPRIPKMR